MLELLDSEVILSVRGAYLLDLPSFSCSLLREPLSPFPLRFPFNISPPFLPPPFPSPPPSPPFLFLPLKPLRINKQASDIASTIERRGRGGKESAKGGNGKRSPSKSTLSFPPFLSRSQRTAKARNSSFCSQFE